MQIILEYQLQLYKKAKQPYNMASEGSREIEAARLRLAAAKTQVSTASKNMDLVTKMMDNAKDMSNAADKEYAEAQIMLAAAEKRWEVIDVDVDDPEPTDNDEGSNKRRKVSLSPQSNNSNNSTTNNTTSSNIANNARARSSDNINQVILEGVYYRSGSSKLNGMYTKIVGQMYNGAPVYTKRVGSGLVNYVIYRDSASIESNNWYISNWNGNISDLGDSDKHIYGSPNNADSMIPPTNGWVVLQYLYSPSPKLRLVSANNDTNSKGASNAIRSSAHDNARASTTPNNGNEVVVKCGLRELNGTYTRVVGDRLVSGSTVEYKRQGQWKGNTVDYVICLILSTRSWEMGFVKRDGKREMRPFYKSPNDANRMCPPENGWLATNPEYSSQQNLPLPTCQLITAPISMRSSLRHSQTLKKCGKCDTLKKRHSYLVVEWDKSDDSERVCKVCVKNHGLNNH